MYFAHGKKYELNCSDGHRSFSFKVRAELLSMEWKVEIDSKQFGIDSESFVELEDGARDGRDDLEEVCLTFSVVRSF